VKERQRERDHVLFSLFLMGEREVLYKRSMLVYNEIYVVVEGAENLRRQCHMALGHAL